MIKKFEFNYQANAPHVVNVTTPARHQAQAPQPGSFVLEILAAPLK